MNHLVMTVAAALGRGSLYADEIWNKSDIAMIGVIVGVAAFVAACLWRAVTAEIKRNARKG